MSFTTNVAAGAAGNNNFTLVVATSTDNRIFYTWWNLGEGAHEWRELEGNGRTDAAPAASFLRTIHQAMGSLQTFAAIKGLGTDRNIYTNTGNFVGTGIAFNGWQLFTNVNDQSYLQTNVAPAATVSYNGILIGSSPVLVATTADGRIFYTPSLGDVDRIGWVVLDGDGRTDAAPAAALVGDHLDYLFVVVKGLDGQLYLNQGQLGQPFVGWQPMGFTTNVAPGATSARNTSVVVATSTDGRIFYTWWRLGEGAQAWVELDGDGRTDAAPAAALVRDPTYDYLFVVVKGLGPNAPLYLNQGQLGQTFVGWQTM